jgi:sulfur-oxidizing protein SoxA
VAKDFEGTTILTAQQVEDVLAFLLTLDDQAPADGPVLPNALSALERVAITAPQGSPYPWLFSGYHVVNEQIQAIQDDDDINPAFLTVEDGARLWSTAEGAAGRSCANCHGTVGSMEGVGIRYPVFHEPSGKLINLEQRINLCRTEQMQAEPWEWGSRELVAMTTLVRHQSRGQPMSVAVDGPARPLFERGKEIYYQRRGLFDMSCAHCHETNYGQRLRGNLLSQGHINAHPIYLSGASAMEFLHELFAFCNRRVRAEPYEYGSEEFVDLELYMAWRGQGLPLETPGVR